MGVYERFPFRSFIMLVRVEIVKTVEVNIVEDTVEEVLARVTRMSPAELEALVRPEEYVDSCLGTVWVEGIAYPR